MGWLNTCASDNTRRHSPSHLGEGGGLLLTRVSVTSLKFLVPRPFKISLCTQPYEVLADSNHSLLGLALERKLESCDGTAM